MLGTHPLLKLYKNRKSTKTSMWRKLELLSGKWGSKIVFSWKIVCNSGNLTFIQTALWALNTKDKDWGKPKVWSLEDKPGIYCFHHLCGGGRGEDRVREEGKIKVLQVWTINIPKKLIHHMVLRIGIKKIKIKPILDHNFNDMKNLKLSYFKIMSGNIWHSFLEEWLLKLWPHIIPKIKFWREWTTHGQKSQSTTGHKVKGLHEWERVNKTLGSYLQRCKTENTTHQIINLIMTRIFIMKE